MDLLRFVTAGSVDDGKSTLIGRLLYDSKAILEDQLEALERTRHERGEGALDLALLTDGLGAEREQGITLDVGYRHFQSRTRRFIIADTPGHLEFTRNMVTGASTSDLALVLVDVRKGLVDQSRRHASIAALLRVSAVVFCVNKMDLVGWSSDAFGCARADILRFAKQAGLLQTEVIPLCALYGDNVVHPSSQMPWYRGPSLLELLDRFQVARTLPEPARFPIQYVIGADGARRSGDRGYAGRMEGGALRVGDRVSVLPSGFQSRIRAIETFDGPVEVARRGMSVTLRLDDPLEIGRGEWICQAEHPARVGLELEAIVCWMAERQALRGERLLLKQMTRTVVARLRAIHSVLDVSGPGRQAASLGSSLALNDLAQLSLELASPIAFDLYRENRATGSFILIDERTQATVGGGMIGLPDSGFPTLPGVWQE